MADFQKQSSRKTRRDSAVNQLRIPPQSIESEQAVLGGIMLAEDGFDRVNDILDASHFYRRDHQLIYQAISELAEKSKPYDAVTLGEWFEANGHAEEVAGGAYLVELASTTPSAANIVAYAEIVRSKSLLRDMIDVGTGIVNDAFQPEGREVEELLSSGEQRMLAIGEQGNRGRKHYRPLKPVLNEVFTQVMERHSNPDDIHGLATGYEDFDALTTGLQPTDLLILAARPSMGKTTLALNVAEHAAVRLKKIVAVFSMEMSAVQLGYKLLSSQARVDLTRLRTGRLEDEDFPRLTRGVGELQASKLFVDDEPSLSPEILRARCRRMKREHGDLGLIVVDYLQLMKVPGSSENRATEISEISRQLKALAKELNVPVIALSQLNRSLETRNDKRPIMADLRESGAIEQDADVIVFVYRDEYYNKENSADKGLAEIIIAKQRNGPTGSFKLRFFGQYSQFANLSRDGFGSFE